MKKLTKTRKMLSNFIEENRVSRTGRPITDFDVKEVSKELIKFERLQNLYKICTILLFILLAVIGLRSCL